MESSVIVYHLTSAEAKAKILASKDWISKEYGSPVFVSNRHIGEVSGYGDAIVTLDVPEDLLTLDDEFPSGERHYWVKATDLRPEHIRHD